jgi:hypothetical protein
MTGPRFTRTADLEVVALARGAPPDPAPLLGRWVNTNPETRGVAAIAVEPAAGAAAGAGGPVLEVWGVGAAGPLDWGAVEGELYFNVEEEDLVPTVALAARYDLGFMAVRLQVRPNKGLLVVAAFTEFRDGSGRRNYFGREFFVRPEVAGAAVP